MKLNMRVLRLAIVAGAIIGGSLGGARVAVAQMVTEPPDGGGGEWPNQCYPRGDNVCAICGSFCGGGIKLCCKNG